MKHLDGEKLYYAFFWGGKEVIKQQSLLNKINVFPIPDGDTGTNLASTMHSMIEKSSWSRSVGETIRSIADSALLGARGNSGAIFAQFVNGLSISIGEMENLTMEDFNTSLKSAVEHSYKAVNQPVEGTMLTVIKDWSEGIHKLKDEASDFIHLISNALETARESLKNTPEKLKVLKDAGVVDAGAKGFVTFLEGMEKFIKNGHPEKIEKLDKSDDLSLEYSSEVQTNQLEHNITFRYCTESLIEGENIDTELIKEKIKGMGDSLVVAGTNKKLKVHIHTNQPADVFYNLNKYGNIIEEKVDDMKMQYEISKNKSNKIALVTDSLCDLPQEFIDKYHIHRVPLSVHFGKTHFLDRVTITPSQFYQMIDESPIYPTSSQPSVRTFQNLYSFLASHYESIIAIHLTDKMSGTWNSSKMASEKISNKKITVINSKEIASSLAMIVWKAAKEISAGKSHDEVVKSIEETMPKTHLFVSVKTLKYMTKSGRITPLKSKIANFFNLKPVILVDDNGNSKLCKDLAFSDKENLKKILKMIENYHKKQGIEAYGVSHAGNLKEAKEFSERIKNTIGISSEFTMDLSPVTGMHVGKGVIAVGIILK